MARKRQIGELNDFTPKKTPKLPRIKNYREGTRFSFQIPKESPASHDCQLKFEVKPARIKNSLKSGRTDGAVVTYDGAQIQNYKLAYPRFASSIDLIPSAYSVGNDGALNYRFCSPRAPGGYWQAQILPIDTSVGSWIDAGGPLYILCPRPYRIDTVTSDGERFKWTKLPGGRQAQVLPDNVIDPELIIFDSPAQPEPIRFEVAIANKPQIKDVLEIYTQPIDFVDSLGYGSVGLVDGISCRSVPCTLLFDRFKIAPSPETSDIGHGYVFSPSSPLPLSWNLPTCDLNYLVATIWQQNTTGQYLDVQSFSPGDLRAFYAAANTHYRLATVYRVGDRISSSYSCRFYLDPANLNVGQGAKAIDVQANTSYGSCAKVAKFNFELKIVSGSDSIIAPSYGAKVDFNRLKLDTKSLASIDIYYNSLSWRSSHKITKLDLGGVIIG